MVQVRQFFENAEKGNFVLASCQNSKNKFLFCAVENNKRVIITLFCLLNTVTTFRNIVFDISARFR